MQIICKDDWNEEELSQLNDLANDLGKSFYVTSRAVDDEDLQDVVFMIENKTRIDCNSCGGVGSAETWGFNGVCPACGGRGSIEFVWRP